MLGEAVHSHLTAPSIQFFHTSASFRLRQRSRELAIGRFQRLTLVSWFWFELNLTTHGTSLNSISHFGVGVVLSSIYIVTVRGALLISVHPYAR